MFLVIFCCLFTTTTSSVTGHFDYVDLNGGVGWACSSRMSRRADVDVYSDGRSLFSQDIFLTTATLTYARPDVFDANIEECVRSDGPCPTRDNCMVGFHFLWTDVPVDVQNGCKYHVPKIRIYITETFTCTQWQDGLGI